MSHDPVDVVIGYHDRTKHYPGRYARSLGYLDWATQPNPFRRFEAAPLTRLPLPPDRPVPAYDQLFQPGTIPPERLSIESISCFFYLSLALSAWKQAGGTRWALRCNPSSGNLHPTEGYAVLPAIPGLSSKAGVYHYAPREHGLEQRAELDPKVFAWLTREFMPEQPGRQGEFCFLAGLSSIYWREAWKYGERAFRYCNHDLGHALAALRIAAAVLGWRLVVLEDLADDEAARLLGLDRRADFAEAEPEHPDLIAAVFPGDLISRRSLRISASAIDDAVAAANWMGRANQLSPDRVNWNIIEAVHQATQKPRTTTDAELSSPSPAAADVGSTAAEIEPNGRSLSAARIIRTRRSALAFDGTTGMGSETLYRMLARVLPGRADGRAVPWDCVIWPARVHLFLFVHRVEGLAPGLYAFVRDRGQLDELKAACDPAFAWSVPELCRDDVPLFLLLEADCRRAAAQLCLGQDIAGTSAFSLGMVAQFDSTLRQAGAWQYRQLFWEAGMIGQVLYLEAEAAGLRATGIGAYFDDLVHETLGLSGHAYQSLYHFTVGRHVEDTRIMSAPAYPAAAM